jgi:hypothetical protein
MLDAFEIISTSGVVLWSRSYADISASLVNDFIHAVFIQDQLAASPNAPYRSQGKTVKWTTAQDLGLVFVVSLSLLPASCLPVRLSTSRSFASRGSTNFLKMSRPSSPSCIEASSLRRGARQRSSVPLILISIVK